MKKANVFMVIIVSCLCLLIIYRQIDKENIYVVYDKSFFSDYKIENNKVFINCELFIYNNFNKEQVIELIAFDNEDVNFGLLKSSKLIGYIQGTDNHKFLLNEGENYFKVSFIGEFGGNDKKINRLLPSKIVVKNSK